MRDRLNPWSLGDCLPTLRSRGSLLLALVEALEGCVAIFLMTLDTCDKSYRLRNTREWLVVLLGSVPKNSWHFDSPVFQLEVDGTC